MKTIPSTEKETYLIATFEAQMMQFDLSVLINFHFLFNNFCTIPFDSYNYIFQ